MVSDIFIITAIGMTVVFTFLLVLIGVLWGMQNLVARYLARFPVATSALSSNTLKDTMKVLDDKQAKQIIAAVMHHKTMKIRIQNQSQTQ